MLAARNVLNLPRAPRMVDVLRAEFERAERADLTVSFVRASGLQMVLPEMKSFLRRGGSLRVLASTYLGVTDPSSLRTLQRLVPQGIRVQEGPLGFHAKTYLFGGRGYQRLYVGSSNWTKGGIADNLEWNAAHEERPVLAEAEELFETLWARPDVREADDAFIGRYERLYREQQARQLRSGNAPDEEDLVARAESVVARDGSAGLDLVAGGPTPRPDQLEALARLDQLRERGARRAVVVAATGVGKTLLSAFHAHRAGARNILFLAHRKEILEQTQRTFRRVFGPRESALLIEGERFRGEPFVFATVQALSRMRPSEGGRALFDRVHDLVVVDEFHHADAPSYRRLIEEQKFRFLLGLTATPERADGHDVLELCDYNIAYELRLPEAIRQRLLLPFHYFGIADELVDYAKIPWRNGQFDPTALENALILEQRVDQLLTHAEEKGFDGPKRVAVGFCAGVRHAKFMAEAVNRRGGCAEAVTGTDDIAARRQIYERLQNPHDVLEWLFVSDVLNEGVDLPAINTLAFLRPTSSSGVFIQQLGRGLRLTEGTEVLTVLDFVGHHRGAFNALAALHDATAIPDARARATLGFRAPERCEFILEERTKEILEKVQAVRRTKKDSCKEAYELLRAELGRPPLPMDTWERTPSFREYRAAFGTWHDLRLALGDAEPWEKALDRSSPVFELLKKAETDWQEQRVTAYAALWAAMEMPHDLLAGFDRFFALHPQWEVERPKRVSKELLAEKLESHLTPLFSVGLWRADVAAALAQLPVLRRAVQDRLLFTVASDFKTRHCGVLRTPADLRLFVSYTRSEIVNYFGLQYDPPKHRHGVLKLGAIDHVLIAKLDTRGAMAQFQYTNRIIDEKHFLWSSQNRMRRDNEAGREITEHARRGNRLHLFVSPSSHQPAMYLGQVSVVAAEGDAPIQVTFRLSESLPPAVLQELSGESGGE